MKKPLTTTFHIGGKQVDKLTDEQLERMAQRLSKAMSRYYSDHPEEYKKLVENGIAKPKDLLEYK